MSYPPATYHGTGEASAQLSRNGAPPNLTYRNKVEVLYLATGASGHGEFGLYRWTFGPTPSGPDPHFHRSISESFFILDGEVELYDGRAWTVAHPGDFLFVPEGGVHGFVEPVRLRCCSSSPRERLARSTSRRWRSSPTDLCPTKNALRSWSGTTRTGSRDHPGARISALWWSAAARTSSKDMAG